MNTGVRVFKKLLVYMHGIVDQGKALEEVFNHYRYALSSDHEIWLDSSNKASWIILLLKEVFLIPVLFISYGILGELFLVTTINFVRKCMTLNRSTL